MSTSSSSDNLLRVLDKLEQQQSEIKSTLETLNLKSRTMRRRKEEVGMDLAAMNQQHKFKESMLEAVKSRVEVKQDQFNGQQLKIEKSQETLKDFSDLTQDQANKRFDMIGEFEEEILKLSDMMSKQCLNGSLKKLDYNLNNLTFSEKDIDLKLGELNQEGRVLEENLVQLEESSHKDLEEIQERCDGVSEAISSKFDLLSKEVDVAKEAVNQSLTERNHLLMSQK